jgi:acyl carrier protein
MGEDSIQDRVVGVIVKKMGVATEKVIRTAKLVDDLGADSLEVMELVMDMEDTFDVSIPDEVLKKGQIKTVGDVIDYIEKVKK